jgi:hypothetical protein
MYGSGSKGKIHLVVLLKESVRSGKPGWVKHDFSNLDADSHARKFSMPVGYNAGESKNHGQRCRTLSGIFQMSDENNPLFNAPPHPGSSKMFCYEEELFDRCQIAGLALFAD